MNKKLCLIATAALFASVVADAAPSLAIGDNAELFLTGAAGIRADDNVLLASNKTSDTIFEVTPGVDLVFGKNSLTKGSLKLAESILRYSDEGRLDTELFAAVFNSSYDNEKLQLKLQAGFREVAQNSVDVRADFLVRRDVSNLGAESELVISPKTSVGTGASYENTDYKPVGYDDSKIVTVPLNAYYEVTPKVDLSLGFRYRDTNLQFASDSQDYFYNVGARGQFTPKLSGRVAIGLVQRNFDRGSDENDLGIDSSLSFDATPKTVLLLGVSNDFGTSGQGQTQKNFSVNGGFQSKVADDWAVNGGLSFRNIEYLGGRKDDYVEGQAGVSYLVNAIVTLNAGYVYRNNDSDAAGADFDNNVFSIAANFRY